MKNALKNFDGVIAGAMMIVTILLVIVNVITRKLFNYIIIWSEEIATSCFVYSVFIGAAYAYRKHQHVGVDLLVERLPAGALVLEDSIGGFPGYYCQQAGFACYHPPIEILTDENVRDCKEHGVKMNVWTVNDMAGLEQLHRWGCEGIITNFPGVASGWLRAQGE